jgi:hypothetical protein
MIVHRNKHIFFVECEHFIRFIILKAYLYTITNILWSVINADWLSARDSLRESRSVRSLLREFGVDFANLPANGKHAP